MNRETARKLLVDYINGHLSGEERTQIEELLQQDGDLELELESIRREISILRGAIADPVEEARLSGLSVHVMNELRNRKALSLWGLPLPVLSYLRTAFAVLLLAVSISLFYLLSPTTPVGPQAGESASAPLAAVGSSPTETAAEAEAAVENDNAQPRSIRMSFATDDPKIRIYWTFSKDFEPLNGGE